PVEELREAAQPGGANGPRRGRVRRQRGLGRRGRRGQQQPAHGHHRVRARKGRNDPAGRIPAVSAQRAGDASGHAEAEAGEPLPLPGGLPPLRAAL
ncbi:hypothetical protein IWQ56_002262, partial [Coemansia nantahalensis]